MAGSRLFAQFSLFGVTVFLLVVVFYTMRFYRYFYSVRPFESPLNLTIEDWKIFLPSPIHSVAISKENLIFSSDHAINLRQEAKDIRQHDLYSISIMSDDPILQQQSIFYDAEERKEGLKDMSIDFLENEFWNSIEKYMNLISQIPPSREIHVTLLVGSESDEISPQTINNARRVAFQLKEFLYSFHHSIPLSISFRILRNLQWKTHLWRHKEGNLSCSVLFSEEISRDRLSSHKFAFSRITSVGITGVQKDISCDYATQLCTEYTFLMYIPDSDDQPLHFAQNLHQKDLNPCSPHFPQSQSLIIPGRRLGIVAYNDHRAADQEKQSNQDLVLHILSQLNSALNFMIPQPFGPVTSSLWSRRNLLISWSSHLYADTRNKLDLLYSLHSNTGIMNLPIQTGNYFPLNNANRKKVENILKKLDFMKICSRMSELFDDRLKCAFDMISHGNLLARDLLTDPSFIEQRKEGIEMIAAILLPFWFPILIPLLYGTYFEIRRFYQKTAQKRKEAKGRAE